MKRIFAWLLLPLLLLSGCCTAPKRFQTQFFDLFDTVTTFTSYASSQEEFQARADRVESSLRRLTAAKLEALSTISNALETCRDHLEDLPDSTPENLAERRTDLEEAIRRVRAREAALQNRSAAPYHRSLRLLRAHPSASAKDFGEVLETLKKLGKD